jgi:hypothetical protein
MSFETRVAALATAIGADIKTLTQNQGTLSSLSTTAKSNLVAAINEIFTIASNAQAAAGAQINDAAGDGNTTQTWSANKIYDELVAAIAALRTELTNGAAAALDTFAELATALNNDPSFATNVATSLGNRVRFDDVQTLTAPQKTQARDNIGAASATDLSDFQTAVGNTDADFVATYTTAKT